MLPPFSQPLHATDLDGEAIAVLCEFLDGHNALHVAPRGWSTTMPIVACRLHTKLLTTIALVAKATTDCRRLSIPTHRREGGSVAAHGCRPILWLAVAWHRPIAVLLQLPISASVLGVLLRLPIPAANSTRRRGVASRLRCGALGVGLDVLWVAVDLFVLSEYLKLQGDDDPASQWGVCLLLYSL